jgi:ubiquinone/menaquinone biosynthesis C-methylase UbiE
MDEKTEELRRAHDVLAEPYAELLADVLTRMPVDRALLDLFASLVLTAGSDNTVCDVGCGSGHMLPFFAERGLRPQGVDLSTEMVRVARRDHPDFRFEVADARALPMADASLSGVTCWNSLMYLAPGDRPTAYGEIARVIRPGGYFATAFKAGDSSLRRGGQSMGVEFDVYWMSPEEVRRLAAAAGLEPVFWGGRAPADNEGQPQGYVIARRT